MLKVLILSVVDKAHFQLSTGIIPDIHTSIIILLSEAHTLLKAKQGHTYQQPCGSRVFTVCHKEAKLIQFHKATHIIPLSHTYTQSMLHIGYIHYIHTNYFFDSIKPHCAWASSSRKSCNHDVTSANCTTRKANNLVGRLPLSWFSAVHIAYEYTYRIKVKRI